MTLLPHLPHCRFVRIRKGQVLFNHELHHEQHVALGVVLAVPQKAGPLRFCQLLSRDCLANEFDQGLHFVTSFFVNPLHIFSPGGAFSSSHKKPWGFCVAVCHAISRSSRDMPWRPASSSRISCHCVL